jgi:hypothetical protein
MLENHPATGPTIRPDNVDQGMNALSEWDIRYCWRTDSKTAVIETNAMNQNSAESARNTTTRANQLPRSQ